MLEHTSLAAKNVTASRITAFAGKVRHSPYAFSHSPSLQDGFLGIWKRLLPSEFRRAVIFCALVEFSVKTKFEEVIQLPVGVYFKAYPL